MAIISKIQDASGTSNKVRVTSRGQLVTGSLEFSTASSAILDTDDTPVNFWAPIAKKNFIITDILLFADKNVGVNDATVTIYETSVGPASATQTKVLLTTQMLKQTSRDFIGLNLEVTSGRWVNAVTDDNNVYVTIMGYYVDVA